MIRADTRAILSVEQMRAYDRAAIDEFGIPGDVLMESAGRAVAEVALSAIAGQRTSAGPVVVLCGGGNNGGDGFVCARTLHNRGVQTLCILTVPESRLSGEAARHFDAMERTGVVLLRYAGDERDACDEAVASASVIIDALLGTGLRGAARSPIDELIERVNAARAYVIAVDVPSGVNGDTGGIEGDAVDADETVTFAYLKPAHVQYPARGKCGVVHVADIGIPRVLEMRIPQLACVATNDSVRGLLPRRNADGHKGTFGHVLVVGGSAGMSGAPALSALAALRSGAGLATVYAPRETCREVVAAHPELMLVEHDATPTADRATTLVDSLNAGGTRKAVVVGPGLSTTAASRATLNAFLHAFLSAHDAPLCIDADGLNLIAQSDEDRAKLLALATTQRERPVVLTPHPGEMARLIGTSTGEVQKNRIAAASAFAAQHRVTVILKGAGTVVAHHDGRVTVVVTGNSGMGTAGSGDVLAGVVGALLAAGADAFSAAVAAAHVHGAAGDAAAARLGQRSLTASDVVETLSAAFVEIERAQTRSQRGEQS